MQHFNVMFEAAQTNYTKKNCINNEKLQQGLLCLSMAPCGFIQFHSTWLHFQLDIVILENIGRVQTCKQNPVNMCSLRKESSLGVCQQSGSISLMSVRQEC